jgi:membrane-bound lytic murein transglycosylase B
MNMLKLLYLLFILLFSTSILANKIPATESKATLDFIDKMVKKHNFDRDKLMSIFSKINLTIVSKKNKGKKTKKSKSISWKTYRSLFITDKRIKNGVKFWHNNANVLKYAEKEYNIPIPIIVAILGVETDYGDKKGDHPTLQTLSKFAFGNYRRRNFYKKELEEFLLMSRENNIPPLSVKGSHAGAMGYPQFISSSYRYYAVDLNMDNKIDLFSNPVDAIGSIANYLDKHNWLDNGKIAEPISLTIEQLKYAKKSTNKPKKPAKYWRNKGFNINKNIEDKTKLSFIKLNNRNTYETWLSFWNFYVLTRYNHDNRYAMVVYQLSEKIKQQFINKTK